MYALAKLPLLSRQELAGLAAFLTTMTSRAVTRENIDHRIHHGTQSFLKRTNRFLRKTNMLPTRVERTLRALQLTYEERIYPLKEQYEDSYTQFLAQPKEHLIHQITNLLSTRLPGSYRKQAHEQNLENRSRLILTYLAEAYEIETEGQSPEFVEQKIVEQYLLDLAEQLERQLEAVDVDELSRELEQELKKLTPRDREQLQRALDLQELTGKNLAKLMRQTGMVVVVNGLLQGAGFGVFMAMTGVLHAVFTSLLGLTLPFSVYTGAAWGLGVLLSPVGITALLVLLSNNLLRKQKRHVNTLVVATVYTAVLATKSA